MAGAVDCSPREPSQIVRDEQPLTEEMEMETQWGDSNEEPRLPDPDEYVKYLSEMPYDLPWSYENPDTLQAEYESIRRRWLLPLVVIWLVVLIVGLVIGITQSGGWSLVGFLLVPTTVIGAAITYIVVKIGAMTYVPG